MFPFANVGVMGAGPPHDQIVEVTTTSAQTLSKPAGAVSVEIELYGAGGFAGIDESIFNAGGGGAYSKTTLASIGGLTALWLQNGSPGSITPNISRVRLNNSSGTVVCAAPSGQMFGRGDASLCVGDVKRSGGYGGRSDGSGGMGGGGAGGPVSNGGDCPNIAVPGAGGGGRAGAGGNGNGPTNGQDYGGGAAISFSGVGGGTGLPLAIIRWKFS